MELCSGTGDWVIEQAKRKTAYWIAGELRHDRVHSIFHKKVQNNLKNLCILGGDCRFFISQLIPKDTLDCVYINFPEPPPFFDHPDHLLSPNFFRDIHRILKPQGKLYIVSDNNDYLQALVKTTATQLHDVYSFSDGRIGAIIGLPKQFGKESSYFDRFWTNGARKIRGHIALRAK